MHSEYQPVVCACIPRQKMSHGITRCNSIPADPMVTEYSLSWRGWLWQLVSLYQSHVLYIFWCLLIRRGKRKTFSGVNHCGFGLYGDPAHEEVACTNTSLSLSLSLLPSRTFLRPACTQAWCPPLHTRSIASFRMPVSGKHCYPGPGCGRGGVLTQTRTVYFSFWGMKQSVLSCGLVLPLAGPCSHVLNHWTVRRLNLC